MYDIKGLNMYKFTDIRKNISKQGGKIDAHFTKNFFINYYYWGS